MSCKTLLIAGVFYSVGCTTSVDDGAAAVRQAPLQQEQAASQALPKGRRTGLTLKDLVDDMAWRKKTFQKMASDSALSTN